MSIKLRFNVTVRAVFDLSTVHTSAPPQHCFLLIFPFNIDVYRSPEGLLKVRPRLL